ncbi:mevalonate kinase family protein [Poseidonocella sedimentorum]|uniref:Mevalonate kinase n=1 Tax=Poseidonocella sedimentorum TaxID=871652 RepID=A0A1I6ER34_9RHOB|nr:hypothetical protein [Poseidonocella sedimentorum]SFR20210.1 mevalonate kinase [Poseidonocella sedimentorum]
MSTSATTSTAPPEPARAHAPGKLILSGEHSVLYGAPALAVAIAQYTEVWFKPMDLAEGLRTAFDDLSSGAFYPFRLLTKFKGSLDRRFEQFRRGELDVQNILTHPDDLAVYALASLLQEGPTPGLGAVHHLPHPGQLGSHSALPRGAGFGSSAAAIAAVTVLFETLLDRPKTAPERVARVRFCERLQHGQAGPIDAATVVHGGLVRAQDGAVSPAEIAEGHSLLRGDGWYWVLHGLPASTTGDCVSHVRRHHGSDAPLWADFAACTAAFADALAEGRAPLGEITANQRLLERIGVVPEGTSRFIGAVEAAGGAAKLCGAGSVAGPHGGAVLVRLGDPEAMRALMARQPELRWSPLRVAPTGAAPGPAPREAEA